MIELIIASIGAFLLFLYLITYGDVTMVLNIHRTGIAIFHERRGLHLFPGIFLGLGSLTYSLYYQLSWNMIQYVFLGLFSIILFIEFMGFPAIFRPINTPQFISYDQLKDKTILEYMQDDLIAVFNENTIRIYPIQPLRMNHIVNDEFKDYKIAITHCALCKTSVVFDRMIDGDELKLHPTTSTNHSNLIIGDDRGNFWQQISGEGLSKQVIGTSLSIIPSKVIRLEDIEEYLSQGYNVEVMNYTHKGRNRVVAGPFDNLMKIVDDPAKKVVFPVPTWDERLPLKSNVIGIRKGNMNYAIPLDDSQLETDTPLQAMDGLSEDPYLANIVREKQLETYRIDDDNNSIEVISPVYWFAWASRYPGTKIITG